MSQKHYLITGGAGFIGSHLTERILKEGHRVTVIDDFNTYYDPAIKHQNIAAVRDQIELVEGDIRDAILVERTFAKGQFDHVIHIAARAGVRPSIKDPKLYFTTNIDGTFNLLDACRYHEVKRFTFASSSSVYGVNKKVPFAESDALERTISPYAATKLAGEQICSNYANLFGIHCQCLRFFTVYGQESNYRATPRPTRRRAPHLRRRDQSRQTTRLRAGNANCGGYSEVCRVV